MDHTIGFVEGGLNDVEVLRVAGVKPAKHCVGDVIGQLHQSGRPGVDEHGGVSQMSDCAERSNLPAQALERCFLSAAVENHEAVLAVGHLALPDEEAIETAAQVFEGEGDTVVARAQRGFFDGGSEAAAGAVIVAGQVEDALHHATRFVLMKSFPGFFTAGKNRGAWNSTR